MAEEQSTPVLIVGAGPVGLTMAIDLAWRGIPCTIVEKTDGLVQHHPKIGLISIRSMELFRRWGFVERIRNCGFPNDYELSIVFCTSMAGYLLERDPYPSVNDMPTPTFAPERKQRCPQMLLDRTLKKVASEYSNISIQYCSELVDFDEDATGVVAHVRDEKTGKLRRIDADYMVACDGATSGVRKKLGIPFSGKEKLDYSVSVLFTAPGLLDQVDKGQAERYIFVGPEGTWGNITVVDGKDEWRLMLFGAEEKFDLTTFDPSAAVRRALGRDDIPFNLISTLPWRRSELLAQKFRCGRVFLAGDSAHTMSPTGGMGVNTGIADVADLGWKLQGRIEGWGGDELLDSYEFERKSVAQRTQRISAHNYANWMSAINTEKILQNGEIGQQVRSQVGRAMKAATQDDWQSWGVQLGYRYEGSSICIPDGSPAPEDTYSDYVQTARPGHRAPHCWLREGYSTLDLFGRDFKLMVFPGAEQNDVDRIREAAAACRLPLSVQSISDDTASTLYGAPLALVRPDGHVCWRGASPEAPRAIVDRVRGA